MASGEGTAKSFWHSLPGFMTGAAALVTAVGTLVTFLVRGGGDAGNGPTTPAGNIASPAGTVASVAAVRVTGVTLRAEPADGTGPCPVTIRFAGTITVDGPGSVAYTFDRADGGTVPTRLLEFDAAGTKEVSIARKLAGKPGAKASGWYAVRIIQPAHRVSERAQWVHTCA